MAAPLRPLLAGDSLASSATFPHEVPMFRADPRAQNHRGQFEIEGDPLVLNFDTNSTPHA